MSSPSAPPIQFTLNVSSTGNGIYYFILFPDAEIIPIEWEDGINGQNNLDVGTCPSRNSLHFPISHIDLPHRFIMLSGIQHIYGQWWHDKRVVQEFASYLSIISKALQINIRSEKNVASVQISSKQVVCHKLKFLCRNSEAEIVSFIGFQKINVSSMNFDIILQMLKEQCLITMGSWPPSSILYIYL